MTDPVREALESIREISEEAWHVRTYDSRLTEIRGIARAALAQPADPVATWFDITLDQAACELLFTMLHPSTPGDEYSELRLQWGGGHSGPGLYVSAAEYPEEGSLLLAAAPPAPQPAGRALTDEEIVRMWGMRSDGPDNHEILSFARAVIAADRKKSNA